MQTTEQLRLRARQCRRLAAAIDDAKARDALTAMAERIEAQLETRVSETAAAEGALSPP